MMLSNKWLVILFMVISNIGYGQVSVLEKAYAENRTDLLEEYLKSSIISDGGNCADDDTLQTLCALQSAFLFSNGQVSSKYKYWIESGKYTVRIVDSIRKKKQLYLSQYKDVPPLPPPPPFPYFLFDDYLPYVIEEYDVDVSCVSTKCLKKIPIQFPKEKQLGIEEFLGTYYPRDTSAIQVPLRSFKELKARISFVEEYFNVYHKYGLVYYFSSSLYKIGNIVLNKDFSEAQFNYYTPWKFGVAIMEKKANKWMIKEERDIVVE